MANSCRDVNKIKNITTLELFYRIMNADFYQSNNIIFGRTK